MRAMGDRRCRPHRRGKKNHFGDFRFRHPGILGIRAMNFETVGTLRRKCDAERDQFLVASGMVPGAIAARSKFSNADIVADDRLRSCGRFDRLEISYMAEAPSIGGGHCDLPSSVAAFARAVKHTEASECKNGRELSFTAVELSVLQCRV